MNDPQDVAFFEIKGRYSLDDGVERERIGDYSYKSDVDPKTGLSARTMRKLEPYREPII